MRLRRLIHVVVAPMLIVFVAGAFSVMGTNAASAAPHFGNTFGPKFGRPLPPTAAQGGWFDNVYNCRGGDVPPGTYSWVVITGQCYMPVGTVTIRDDLTVAPGALLDAVTPGDPVHDLRDRRPAAR